MPKGLVAAPKNGTLRMDGPTHPRSCRHIPVPPVRPSHSVTCPVIIRLLMPRLLLLHITFGHGVRDGAPSRVHEETSYAGGTGSSFEKLDVQNGPSSPPKKLQPTPWCAVCKTHVGWYPDSVSDSESECCDLEGLGPSSLLQHSKTSQSTGCFHSLCPAQYRTLGICPQPYGSGANRRSCRMSGLPKPWEMDADTRHRRVRALLIQAALWAPTTTEKDAILEAMQEQQVSEDFQLSPTQPVVRRVKAAPVVQVKSPPTLRWQHRDV